MSGQQKQQLSALQDVTGVLLSFIKSSPEAWAPVVSSVSDLEIVASLDQFWDVLFLSFYLND